MDRRLVLFGVVFSSALLCMIGCGDEPELSYTPMSLSCNYPDDEKTLTVWNSGNDDDLDWSVSEDYEWLSCSPTSGTSNGEDDEVSVRVNFNYFQPLEVKAGAIEITSNGGDATVYMTATRIVTTSLSFAPSSLSFTDPVGSLPFEIWNSGTGILWWFVSEGYDWLSCSPYNGSSTGEHDVVNVIVNWSYVDYGETKNGTISITSTDGGNESVSVTATRSDPILSCTPSSLSFEYPVASRPFEIWNSGTGTLSWTVYENYNWLNCSPISGSSTGEHDFVGVSVNWGLFSAGETKNGTINISSLDGDSETVSVTATRPS